MKALRLHGVGDLRLADEPASVPGPAEALVRVTAVGICGSDLHWYDESGIGDAMLTQPLILGHEAAGVIVDGPRAGQRVALDPQVSCGACETCAAGRGHLCPQVRFLGHSLTDGAMRELLAWPVTKLVPLPDAIETAVILARPAGTVVVAGIPAGDRSTIAASIARRKGLDLRFSRRMNRAYPRAIAMVEAGLVEVSSLVTHRFAIAEFEAAFQTAVRRDGLKVIIDPSAPAPTGDTP